MMRLRYEHANTHVIFLTSIKRSHRRVSEKANSLRTQDKEHVSAAPPLQPLVRASIPGSLRSIEVEVIPGAIVFLRRCRW